MMHIFTQNQTSIYNQAPNLYTNHTPSPRHPRCTTPTKQELVPSSKYEKEAFPDRY
ncbi:hypothetical protein BDZ94DRAFT_1262373 [Collybia nuda]|uniref:Uncharacterized protein n=1 Tax=Collybia nuda TaxID=64659 RepID=A0A9P6CIH5_9AGAR|nr:hypothetical protein BDZ94DRAFT_1262373 [Collybia nuda]